MRREAESAGPQPEAGIAPAAQLRTPFAPGALFLSLILTILPSCYFCAFRALLPHRIIADFGDHPENPIENDLGLESGGRWPRLDHLMEHFPLFEEEG